MVLDYFNFALNNLRRRGLRSWLTMLGIFIGIAAVVSLISLGEGLQAAIAEQFEQIGSDKVIIQPKGRLGPPGSETAAALTIDDLDVIEKVRGVESVSSFLIKTARVEFDDAVKFNFVVGLPSGERRELIDEAQFYKIAQGRELGNGEKGKVVVGYNYGAGRVFDKPVKLRDTINIQGKDFKVIGILERIGNPFDDSSLLIDEEELRDTFKLGDEVSQILVKVSDEDELSRVSEDIEEKLRKEKNEGKGKESFEVQTPEQLLGTISTVFSIVTAVLIGIAAISLVVGGIGIANTMYTSVIERTKEIGIMKAVGAKNSDVLTIFLMEAGLLGLVGGMIGIALGIGIGEVVEIIATRAIGSPLLNSTFSLPLVLGALAFSFIIGSVSGLLLARQAASLRPVDALRHE